MTAPENTRERLAEALMAHRILTKNHGGRTGCRGCRWQSSARAGSDAAYAEHAAHAVDALLPLIDTLLREQREGIAAAIQRMTLPSEALEHPYPVDVATAAAADLARTFGGER